MPTRRTGATINLASVVYGLDGYLRTRDVDPEQVLHRVGIDRAELADPERRVPLVRYLDLLELCADALSDRLFGLRFGLQYDPRHGGVAGNVALAAPRLGDALAVFARYLPTVVDVAVYGVERKEGSAFAYSYYVDPLMMCYQQKADWTVGFTISLIRRGIGDPRWAPAEALFPHLSNESPRARRERSTLVGNASVAQHAWAGVRFAESLLDAPMATADPMVARLMHHYGDLRLSALPGAASEIEQLRREVARLVLAGRYTLNELATSLGTSPRTLQRRLTETGVSFSDLLRDVRATLALNLLDNSSLALAEIAFSLGYSDVSAFNHAFRRWVGRSPGEHRSRRFREN